MYLIAEALMWTNNGALILLIVVGYTVYVVKQKVFSIISTMLR